MYFKVEKSKADDGRSPHGERGLKYDLYLVSSDYIKSLSSRRAWVEITEKKTLQIISRYFDKYRNRYNVYNNVNGDEDEWTYANENNDLDLVVDWKNPVEIYVDFNFWSENEEIEEYLKEKYGKQIEQNTDLLKKEE